jgi:DNA-binding MarR family transcriptional regulator
MPAVNSQASHQDPAALATELRGLIGKLKRRLREQASRDDLTSSQMSVLVRLERDGPATVSSLARAEAMRSQSMGSVVAALQAAGLVKGAPDPQDGRQILFSLTPACRKRIQQGRAARQDWLHRALQSKLSSKEQEQLAAVLPLLKRLAED